MKGWVYVIKNKAIPGLVKVGYSLKDPEIRASELNNTGVPHRYVVDYSVLVENPYQIEQEAHGLLNSHREAKEWFRCSSEEAVAAIKKVAGSCIFSENYAYVSRENAEAIVRQKILEDIKKREECNTFFSKQKEIEEKLRKNFEKQLREYPAPGGVAFFIVFIILGIFANS